MVTRNWYSYFKANRAATVIVNGFTDVYGSASNAGYYQSSGYGALLLSQSTAVWAGGTSGVVFGSDPTPPTIDDYKLGSQITSGLSASLASSVSADGDPVRTYLLQNTSSEDITVAEVGMIYKCYTGANSSSGEKYCLFDRTVLDSPVTIPAGGVGQITYTIRMNYPTA